jgi:hypothetical protein
MPLATLSIDIVAQLAKFEGDMRRAAGVVEQSARRMESGFGGLKAVFAGSLLAGFAEEAARAVVRLVPALVEGVAQLQDLEEKTGASAAALAAMVTPADVAGVSMDQLAGFMVKLTGNLSKTTDASKGTGAALKYLGLDLETFRAQAPEEQFRLLAERLNTLPDGANKTAVAIALLGKSGADSLPFLKELAQTGLSQNRVTKEQIVLADELTDRNARLRSELKQAAQVAALQMLPAFNALTEGVVKAVRGLSDVDGQATQLAANTGIRSFAEGVAEGLGVIADAGVFASKALAAVVAGARAAAALNDVKSLGVRDPAAAVEFITKGTGPMKEALAERERAVAESTKRMKALFDGQDFAISAGLRDKFGKQAIAEQLGINNIGTTDKPPPPKPPKPFVFNDTDRKGANKALREAEQERKALLDAQLKDLEAALGTERSRLDFHGDYLERVYSAGALNVAEFYNERRAIEARGLQQQLATFKAEEAALRAFLAKTTDPSERVRTQARIDDIRAKSAAAQERYSQQAVLGYQAEAQATQQATDRLREFQAQLLELEGNAAGAARMRADAAIEQARRSARGIGLSADDIASFERATQASLTLGTAQRNVQRITGELASEEERVAIAAQASGASRTQVEQQLFALRSRALEQMRQELVTAEALANAADPDSPAVQFARELRLEFERLSLVVDPALERLRQVGDEVADALGQAAAAISVNFRDAKSIVDSLGQSLLASSTRELVEKPLGDLFRQGIRSITEPGQGGGFGDMIRKAFGVNAGAPSATAGISALLPTASQGAAVQLNALAAAAANATRSLGGASVLEQPIELLGDTAFDLSQIFRGLNSSAFNLDGVFKELPNALAGLFNGGGGGGGGNGVGTFLSSIFGFDRGGYTGSAPVNAPAGVVHGQEFVFSAPAVRRLGVDALERLHGQARRGQRAFNLPGYESGGYVVPRVQASAPRGGGSSSAHYDFRGAQFGGGGQDRAGAERQAVLTGRAIRREIERHSA